MKAPTTLLLAAAAAFSAAALAQANTPAIGTPTSSLAVSTDSTVFTMPPSTSASIDDLSTITTVITTSVAPSSSIPAPRNSTTTEPTSTVTATATASGTGAPLATDDSSAAGAVGLAVGARGLLLAVVGFGVVFGV